VLAVSVIVLILWLDRHRGQPLVPALRHTAINATSIMTTTGCVSQDFGIWGPGHAPGRGADEASAPAASDPYAGQQGRVVLTARVLESSGPRTI
jgi:hypothetical protein